MKRIKLKLFIATVLEQTQIQNISVYFTIQYQLLLNFIWLCGNLENFMLGTISFSSLLLYFFLRERNAEFDSKEYITI